MSVNLNRLLKKLKEKKCDFYLISTFDEFLNEYTPNRNMRLKYITNFSGSNGLALISESKKFFFTDGRYLLQAEKEIDKDFEIVDIGLIDFFTFLKKKIQKKQLLVDFRIFSISFIKKLIKISNINSLKIRNDKENIIDEIWDNRPEIIYKKFFFIKQTMSGESTKDKKKKIITDKKDHIFIITSPESVCWLLNIRGYDLPYTPIVFSRAIVSKSKIKFFVDIEKVPKKGIKGDEVKIYKSEYFEKEILKLSKKNKIFMDDMTSYYFYDLMISNGFKPTMITDPCKIKKSQKNYVEIQHAKGAHVWDGVCLVKYFYWLENQKFSSKLTEYNVAKKLEEFRKENKNFFSLSFPTISATGANASIIHYIPSKVSKKLAKGHLYLCDSGGQYFGATTDVTRTIYLGKKKPKKELISNYTKVLIGHINLAMVKFPVGTKGNQIDSVARYHLWQSGLDYNHGTGHGVGSFLGVHEGPQSIAKRFNNHALKEGMILSNEPGYYKKKNYGIRIENLLLVKRSKYNDFLEFENLTLFPYEKNLINVNFLTKSQRAWVDSYHSEIYQKLSKFLPRDIREWLLKKTEKI